MKWNGVTYVKGFKIELRRPLRRWALCTFSLVEPCSFDWAILYPKDSARPPAACYSNFVLVITSTAHFIQSGLVFCLQHQTRLFVNSICKPSLLSLKTPNFFSLVGHNLGCYLNLCSWNAILRSQRNAL